MTKQLFSFLAILLTFGGFLPYVASILNARTKPHVFSWLIWGSTTFVVFLAQLQDGAGVGAWPIGISGVISLGIAFLAYSKKAGITVTHADRLFLLAAASALPVWYVTSDPLWAVVILTTIDLLGFGPTIRKAYYRPFEENLLFFSIFALRNTFVILALEHYSLTTVLFPAATGIACLALLAVVTYRRRSSPHSASQISP